MTVEQIISTHEDRVLEARRASRWRLICVEPSDALMDALYNGDWDMEPIPSALERFKQQFRQ
jgi:hypothetical protein